jgi:predicted site-specific integrase-resolvase
VDGIVPRPGDGRISRYDAAALARVSHKTITRWISLGYLKDVRREGRRVWLSPAEVIDVEYRVHQAERARMQLVLGQPAA